MHCKALPAPRPLQPDNSIKQPQLTHARVRCARFGPGMLTPTRRTGWTAPAASKACPLVKGGRPIKQHRGQRASLLQSYSNAHAHNPGQASAAAPAWSAAKKKPRHWQQRVDPDVLTRQLLAWSVVPAVLLAAQPLLAVGQASLAWQVRAQCTEAARGGTQLTSLHVAVPVVPLANQLDGLLVAADGGKFLTQLAGVPAGHVQLHRPPGRVHLL